MTTTPHTDEALGGMVGGQDNRAFRHLHKVTDCRVEALITCVIHLPHRLVLGLGLGLGLRLGLGLVCQYPWTVVVVFVVVLVVVLMI